MQILNDYKIKPIEKSKDDPLISVCVAVYNSEDYLPRCIDSILDQTYENLQIILVDDGSTDSCGKICDEYAAKDPRIEVIHKTNGGLYTSRNSGIEAAKGEYICFLDGDDYIDPCMYENMLSALRDLDCDLAVCRYKQVFEDGIKDGSTGKTIIFDSSEILEQFLKEDEHILIQNSAWNKLYKRSLISSLRFPARWYEDMLYTPQLLNLTSRSVYLDTAWHNYICDRSSSIMNKGVNKRIFTDLIPNFYDRSAFLESIGRHDLALISDYFLYKKLLLYVTDVYRSSEKEKKDYLSFLDEKLRDGKDRYAEIFGIDIANPNEYKKMKIYLKSPLLYHITMRLNDSLVIPLKRCLIRMKGSRKS